eukprot:51627-Eustigmatos_ZCMA.PRE.1
MERVRALVEQDQELVHAMDHFESAWTPLIYAACHGHTAVVLYLLDHCAAINYRSPVAGATALLLASLNRRNAEVVQVLLERGADVTLVGPEGNTALMRATIAGRDAVVRVLLEHGG